MRIPPKKEILLISLILTLCCLITVNLFGEIRLKQATQCSLSFAAADTTKTCTLGDEFRNSELHSLLVITPNWASNATTTISVKDPAGNTLYSKSGIAESYSDYIPLSRPMTFGSSYVILLTTTAGTDGGTVTIDSWVYK